MIVVFRTIAKTAKYPEEGVKKLAIKSLSMIQKIDTESLNSLLVLFDLAQDDDAEIRKIANDAIIELLASEEKGSSSGGGGGGGGLGEAPPPISDYYGAP